MTATIEEVEASAVHAPGEDLTRYQAPVMEEYRARFVMQPEEAAALDDQLRACMRAVLKENVDYGLIPGMGNKPSLFKPGAEKLMQWFGFGFINDRDEIERDTDGKRVGVTYKCTVFKELADGRRVTVATCEGYAGYDEDKFYVSAETNEAKERANAEKYRRGVNALKFTEYRAPWNSLLKMAQKRSLVGAAIDATSAAGLFTQDLEDMREAAASDGFTAAAEASIMALPEDVRGELDRWYRGQKWPDPSRWSAEQWCAALQTAGALAARGARPQEPASTPKPAPAPAADATWLDGALVKAISLPTLKACQELWRESAAKVRGGELAKEDATRLQKIVAARMADLRIAQAAAALDPEDPWAAKVDSLASADEAAGALAEVAGLLGAGHIDQARADQVSAAITARFPQAASETRAAA